MIKETLNRLNRDAETIRNTAPVDLSNMEPGDEHRQGDLRIIRLPDGYVAKNASRFVQVFKPSRQLAPGTTQGSRHELSTLDGIKVYRLQEATEVDGPVIEADIPFAINHPEHGDAINLPAGCYAFPGQRAYADELRRVAD
jgi:hypothetical protein